MITLNTDIYLICSMFNVSSKKISDEYSGMSVEEIMEAEAKQGNTAAANFDLSVLSDPVKLIQLFQLNNPENKYAILSNMSEHDLEELLPLLDQNDLVAGLNFFTKDKLLALAEELPKDQLVNMTFQMFSPEEVMQLMPEEQLNKLLQSPDMDKGLELKYMKSMKPEILAQMLEGATGMSISQLQEQSNAQNQSGLEGQEQSSEAGEQQSDSTQMIGRVDITGQPTLNGQAIYNQIAALPDDKFQEAMLNIPPQNKRNFILKMTQEQPKLFLLFDSSAYTNMIDQKKQKSDMVQAAQVIAPDQLVKMTKDLPADLTAVLLTQMDTKQFADILLSKFKNILSELAAG